MLHFRMNMPFYLMAMYGSVMIMAMLLLRLPLKSRLPKLVFPMLWGMVLLRFVIPFSLSSPLSMPVPPNPFSPYEIGSPILEAVTVVEDTKALTSGTDKLPAVAQNNKSVGNMETTVISEGAFGYTWADNGWFPFFNWQNILTVIYFVGLAALAGVLGWQKYGYYKRLRKGLLIEHNETVNAMLRSMDMGHVLVFSNDEIAFPLVCGLLNPRIYLPTQMDFRNTRLLRHVLAHETMHIRRKDNWVRKHSSLCDGRTGSVFVLFKLLLCQCQFQMGRQGNDYP